MPSTPDASPAPPSDDARLEEARQRVVRLLTDRYADDTLTVEEFEARLDRMHALGDPAALDAMARELAVARPATTDVPAVSRAAALPSFAPPYAAPVVPAEPPRRSFVVMGDQKHRGAFALSTRWEIRSVMSSVRLDLREAHFPDGVCDLDLFAMMSNFEILVPGFVTLTTDVGGIMASVDTPQATRAVLPVLASLRIQGMAVMSSVEVRVAPAWMPVDAPFKAAWRAAQLKD